MDITIIISAMVIECKFLVILLGFNIDFLAIIDLLSSYSKIIHLKSRYDDQYKFSSIYFLPVLFSDVPTTVKVHMYVNSFDSIRESSMVSILLII